LKRIDRVKKDTQDNLPIKGCLEDSKAIRRLRISRRKAGGGKQYNIMRNSSTYGKMLILAFL